MASPADDSSDWSDIDEFCNTSSELFDDGSASDDDYFNSNAYESFEWKKSKDPTDCQRPEFTGDAGIKANIGSHASAIDLFELFFDDEVTNLIVTNTNIRASQKLSEENKETYSWTDATSQDVKKLVALMLLDTVEDYRGEIYRSLRQYQVKLHLVMKFIDFGPTESTSIVTKAKPLIDLVVRKFKEALIPEQDLLMESRTTIGQNRTQLVKHCFSIETYVLCEIASGYIWNFLVRLTHPRDESKFGEKLKDKIMKPLMQELFGKGYCLYTMNYYNTLEIALFIKENNTGYIGMLVNYVKNIPKELLEKNISVNESFHLYEKSGRFMLMKWRNKRRTPIIVSTFHNGDDMIIVTEKGKDKIVPKLVNDYETADKNIVFDNDVLSSFPFEIGYKINVRKIFRHVVNMMASNAHAIYKKQGGALTQGKFTKQVVRELLAKYNSPSNV